MSATPRPGLFLNLSYLGGAEAYIEEVLEVIGRGPLFEQFSRAEIAALCQFLHCFASPRGRELLVEGQEGDYLLIVLSGEVAVVKHGSNGEQIEIATVGPGATLGEMSLIDGERRFADCITTTPTDFAVLTRDDLNELMLMHPRLANKFFIRLMQILVERLRYTGNRLLTNYLNPVG